MTLVLVLWGGGGMLVVLGVDFGVLGYLFFFVFGFSICLLLVTFGVFWFCGFALGLIGLIVCLLLLDCFLGCIMVWICGLW